MSDAEIFETTLTQQLAQWLLEPSPEQLGQMASHHGAMVETNRSMNLTRITEPAESAIRHFTDSLALLAWSQSNATEIQTVLDVGTGAGFPAVPLAIMRPDWKITAIDGTKKKTDFVRESASAIGLANLKTEHAHTTHWTTSETFDVVAARALAKLPEAIEQTARFVGYGGHLVAYKSASINQEEREAGEQTAKQHGLKCCEPFEYQLTIGEAALDRVLIVFQKI